MKCYFCKDKKENWFKGGIITWYNGRILNFVGVGVNNPKAKEDFNLIDTEILFQDNTICMTGYQRATEEYYELVRVDVRFTPPRNKNESGKRSKKDQKSPPEET